jgi:hypothetical protein
MEISSLAAPWVKVQSACLNFPSGRVLRALWSVTPESPTAEERSGAAKSVHGFGTVGAAALDPALLSATASPTLVAAARASRPVLDMTGLLREIGGREQADHTKTGRQLAASCGRSSPGRGPR